MTVGELLIKLKKGNNHGKEVSVVFKNGTVPVKLTNVVRGVDKVDLIIEEDDTNDLNVGDSLENQTERTTQEIEEDLNEEEDEE